MAEQAQDGVFEGREFYVPLGGDYYCETCGPTYNHIEIEESEPDQWDVLVQHGCYGTRGVIGNNREGTVAWLKEEKGHALNYEREDFQRAIDWLEEQA